MKPNQQTPSLSDILVKIVLWEGSLSKILQHMYLFGSNLQCIAILLWSRCVFMTDTNLGNLSLAINKVCEIISINLVFDQNLNDVIVRALLLVLYLSLMVFLVVIVFLILLYFYWRKQVSDGCKLWITYIGQFYLTFGFWYMIIILFSTLVDSPFQRMMVVKLNLPYLLIIISSVFLIAISYVFGIFIALFSYDPIINQNILSCHTPAYQFLTFLFKAGAAPIFVMSENNEEKTWLFVFFALVVLILRHYNLLNSFPFYEYKTMKQAITLSSFCLVTSLVNLIALALQKKSILSMDITIYIEVIVTYLAFRFWNCYFEKTILSNLGKCGGSLCSQDRVLKKIFSINYFLKNTDPLINENQTVGLNEMYFWGIISDCSEILEKEAELGVVPQAFQSGMSNTLTINKLRVCLSKVKQQIVRNLLEEHNKRLKESYKLKILFISLFAKTQENIPFCLLHLISLSKARGIERIIASKLSLHVQEYIYTSFNSKNDLFLDIRSHLSFEKISEKFAKLVHSSCQKQMNFWTGYEDSVIKVQDLYKQCNQIEQEHDEIFSFWTNQIEPNKVFASFLVVTYSLYLFLIRNRPGLAAKTLKKQITYKIQQTESSEKNAFLSQEILNDKSTLTFYTSMSKESLGNILDVSPHIGEVLGWGSQDIVGKNINVLIPLFIKENHNQAIERYLHHMEDSTKLNRILNTFILDRMGYILPCQLYISLHPDIQKELVYIAIVKVKKAKEDYIILNTDGYISAFSQTIGEKLDLIFEDEVHIEEICQNYHQLQRALMGNKQAERKGISQRKLEKNARSFRVKVTVLDSGKLSSSGSNKALTKINSPAVEVTLDFVNLRASKKKSDPEIFQYSTIINQEHTFNLNFYLLRLKKIIPKELDFEQVFKNLNKTREIADDLPLVPQETYPDEKAIQVTTSPFSPRNPLVSSLESESNRRLIQLSPVQLSRRTLIKTIKSEVQTLKFKADKKTKVTMTNESSLAKKGEENNEKLEDILNTFDLDLGDTKSEASNENSNTKIENSVHAVPKRADFAHLKVIVVLLILISRIFLVTYYFKNNHTLNHLESNLEILSQTNKMLSQIVEINRGVRYLLLADLELLTPERFNGSLVITQITNIKRISAFILLQYTSTTNALNNNIKRSINRISEDLQNNILQTRIPVYELDDSDTITVKRSAQIFDLVTEVIAKTISLSKTPGSNFSLYKQNYYFLLNNTINDLLVAGEGIIPILIEDSNLQLDSQARLIAIMLGIMGLLSIYLCSRLYKTIREFVKKRNHFINIFIRLESEHLISHRLLIKRFALVLEKNNFSTKGLESRINNHMVRLPSYRQENTKYHKKSVTKKGINSSLIRISLYTVFYVVSILFIYFVIYFITNYQNSLISGRIDLMTQSNKYLYQLTQLFSMQYEYIQENISTKIRNKPIKEEYQSMVDSLAKSHDFFVTTLLDPDNGLGTNSELSEVIKGDICNKILTGNSLADPQCPLIKGGILRTGIIGLISLFLSLIKETITSFDNSDRTFSDMLQSLNSPDLVLEEVISTRYAPDAYLIVDSIIQNHIKDNFDDFRTLLQTLVIVYAIYGLISGILSWNKISKALEKEIKQWDKMIRQIPLGIIVNNKLFKTYLKETGQEILT